MINYPMCVQKQSSVHHIVSAAMLTGQQSDEQRSHSLLILSCNKTMISVPHETHNCVTIGILHLRL